MNLVPVAIANRIARQTLLVQKNSPTVLFAAGTVGVVTGAVLACRATLKIDEVLEESKTKQTLIKTTEHPEYSEHDRRRDMTLLHVQTGVKIVRLYGPAVIVGGLSIAMLVKSHRILTQRNAALTAAYALLDKGFKEYRARVVDRYGRDVDQELRYGSERIEISDPNDGRKKQLVTRVGPGEPSIYARFFDQFCPDWGPNPEYNLIFLKAQQNYWNNLLLSRGHVFLNEVYRSLGMEHSKAGAVVGWVVRNDRAGDNFIDFGIFDGENAKAREFVNGREGAILLDFNVDGVIYDIFEHGTGSEALSWQRKP